MRPDGVQVVDDVGMGMPVATVDNSLVPVGMTGGQPVMGMLDHLRIASRPEPRGSRHGGPRYQCEDDSSRGKSEHSPCPTRKRIGDEPADVRERELGGEQRGGGLPRAMIDAAAVPTGSAPSSIRPP